MNRSIKLLQVRGIPIKVHWTFGLLLLFLAYMGAVSGWVEGVYLMGYVFMLFTCVVLHELGHALMAQRYGVGTNDIILSPIGGLARLVDIPDKPWQEFFIAIAGPLVNLVIAAICGVILWVGHMPLILPNEDLNISFSPLLVVQLLFIMNVILFCFNLLPAFPMDGGRILRSLLALRLTRLRATFIAMIVARVLAVGFVLFAMMNGQIVLGFIALFVFVSSGREYRNLKIQDYLRNTSAGDVMVATMPTVDIDMTFRDIGESYDAKQPNNYLVVEEGQIVGTLAAPVVAHVLENAPTANVREYLSQGIRYIPKEQSLETVFATLQSSGEYILAIGDANDIQGFVDRNLFSEILKRLR